MRTREVWCECQVKPVDLGRWLSKQGEDAGEPARAGLFTEEPAGKLQRIWILS